MKKNTLISKLTVLAAAAALMLGANSVLARGHSEPSSQSSSSVDKTAEECKNVPDGGATVLLVGLGLGAVALASRKRR